VRDEDLARVSPLAHAHVFPNGSYFVPQATRRDRARTRHGMNQSASQHQAAGELTPTHNFACNTLPYVSVWMGLPAQGGGPAGDRPAARGHPAAGGAGQPAAEPGHGDEMSEAEDGRLYGLMEVAEGQQAAVQAALEGLAAERAALRREREALARQVQAAEGSTRAVVRAAVAEGLAGAATEVDVPRISICVAGFQPRRFALAPKGADYPLATMRAALVEQGWQPLPTQHTPSQFMTQ